MLLSAMQENQGAPSSPSHSLFARRLRCSLISSVRRSARYARYPCRTQVPLRQPHPCPPEDKHMISHILSRDSRFPPDAGASSPCPSCSLRMSSSSFALAASSDRWPSGRPSVSAPSGVPKNDVSAALCAVAEASAFLPRTLVKAERAPDLRYRSCPSVTSCASSGDCLCKARAESTAPYSS